MCLVVPTPCLGLTETDQSYKAAVTTNNHDIACIYTNTRPNTWCIFRTPTGMIYVNYIFPLVV